MSVIVVGIGTCRKFESCEWSAFRNANFIEGHRKFEWLRVFSCL